MMSFLTLREKTRAVIKKTERTQESVWNITKALLGIAEDCKSSRSHFIAAFAIEVVESCQIPDGANAFGSACVIVLLDKKFPETINCTFAELHKACMYTVPKVKKYIKVTDSADHGKKTYFREVGFKEEKGRFDPISSYLARLERCMDLYANLASITAEKMEQEMGLVWLQTFTSGLPCNHLPALSALTTFLKVAGFAIHGKNSDEFQQLMELLKQKLSVVDPDWLGPKFVAESLISDINDGWFLKEPEGRDSSFLENYIVCRGDLVREPVMNELRPTIHELVGSLKDTNVRKVVGNILAIRTHENEIEFVKVFAEAVLSIRYLLPGRSEYAFAYLIILVTSEIPNSMDSVMDAFHSACCYTIPIRLMEVSQVELGDLWDESCISCNLVVYAALLQQGEIKSGSTQPGPEAGFAWLESVESLRLEYLYPTILATFLKVAGYGLYQYAKGRFVQLVKSLYRQIDRAILETPGPYQTAIQTTVKLLNEYIEQEDYLKEPKARRTVREHYRGKKKC